MELPPRLDQTFTMKNPKSEYRNPKQTETGKAKFKNPKRPI